MVRSREARSTPLGPWFVPERLLPLPPPVRDTHRLPMKTVPQVTPITLSGSRASLGQRHLVTLGSDLDGPHPLLGLGFLAR